MTSAFVNTHPPLFFPIIKAISPNNKNAGGSCLHSNNNEQDGCLLSNNPNCEFHTLPSLHAPNFWPWYSHPPRYHSQARHRVHPPNNRSDLPLSLLRQGTIKDSEHERNGCRSSDSHDTNPHRGHNSNSPSGIHISMASLKHRARNLPIGQIDDYTKQKISPFMRHSFCRPPNRLNVHTDARNLLVHINKSAVYKPIHFMYKSTWVTYQK